jgi:hypothetical protein
VAVWLHTVKGERYRLAQRADESDEQIMRSLLNGGTHEWAPVVRAGGGWLLVNLAHVVKIETGPDEDIRESFL